MAFSAEFTAIAEHLDRIDTDNDLIILGNIAIEKRISALEALAEAGASGGKEVLEEVDAISYNIGDILQGNLILRQYCFPGANGCKPALLDLQEIVYSEQRQLKRYSFVGVLSQSGNSNIGKGFNWNPEAVVFFTHIGRMQGDWAFECGRSA